MGLIIHIDGGARGNPGPAGAGVVIRGADGSPLHEAGYFLGRQTNNAAEYHALIRALKRVTRCGSQPVTVHSDSELLVRQMTGEYQVKSPTLARLHQQVQLLLLKVPRWSIRHVCREENRRADELANLAMDRRADVIVFDADSEAEPTADVPGEPKATAPETLAPEAAGESPAGGPDRQAVRVTVAHPPQAENCPAGGIAPQAFTVSATLPAGLCVHGAHAILPTLLAMLNADPEEFAAIPTLTLRCGQRDCGAEFLLSPVQASNGAGPRDGE